jgi:cysteine-rich repeat protein
VTKKCLAGDPVLGNYANGHPDTAFFPTAESAVEASGTTLLGSPQVQGDKAKIKCHAAISKVVVKDIAEILKNAVKCQGTVDKIADTFGQLAGDCIVTPSTSGPKGETAISKACGAITGADVGSCDPLPTCVTASATATGQALATAIYGQPTPGCGNSIVDPGEECDDGNDISTDGCIDCKLATCGDGFVEAGVELCGDSLTEACTSPSQNSCQVTPCAAGATKRTVTVRFAKPAALTIAGLVIALDYPETQVRIPGVGGSQDVLDRVTVVPSGLPTVDDRDYEVQVSVTAFPIDPGDFFSVQFDDCDATTAPTLDEFACIVRAASSDVGADVTNQVTCSLTSP